MLSAAPASPRLRLSQASPSGDLLLAEAGGTAQFRLTGTGDGQAAGSWQSGGADYAEWFEWADGNPERADRRGLSVVLVGDKIRPARTGEDPIGVISAAPALLGDADLGEWSGKYSRDVFGTPLEEAGPDGVLQRKISADFDPNKAYVPRAQRPEWAMVGLLGKLTLRTGQPTDPRWRRLASLDPAHALWLVR